MAEGFTSLGYLRSQWESAAIEANGYPNYEAGSMIVNSTSSDTTYTLAFTSKRIVYIKNDGPSDVYLSFNVATGTAKKTILLKASDALVDVPLGGVTSIRAKLVTSGDTVIRFMVVG